MELEGWDQNQDSDVQLVKEKVAFNPETGSFQPVTLLWTL